MDTNKIAHDLTILIISDVEKTPDAVVNAYYNTFPKVQESLKKYHRENKKQGVIISRSEFGV